MKENINDVIERGIIWFINSEMQDLSLGSETYGSFRAWYDMDSKTYTYPYSEITGYALTTLAYLKTLGYNGKILEKADIGANWLVKKAKNQTYGGYHCRYIEEGFHPWLCSFDNAMILNGFVNLYEITGNQKYLSEAEEVGNWLIDFMLKENGIVIAKYDTQMEQYIDTQERWSTQSGGFLAKNAIGLINLSEKTDNEKYAQHARKMCDIALELQEVDGRFITNKRLNDTYMHPHCYTVEGLLATWLHFGDDRYINACYDAADWIKKAQLENGAIPRIFDSRNFSHDISTDSTAQSLRIWVLLAHYGDYPFPEKQGEKIANFLMNMQCKDENDGNGYGGFYYGITDNQLVRHISDHGTMFTLQTLQLYNDLLCGDITFNIHHLI